MHVVSVPNKTSTQMDMCPLAEIVKTLQWFNWNTLKFNVTAGQARPLVCLIYTHDWPWHQILFATRKPSQSYETNHKLWFLYNKWKSHFRNPHKKVALPVRTLSCRWGLVPDIFLNIVPLYKIEKGMWRQTGECGSR